MRLDAPSQFRSYLFVVFLDNLLGVGRLSEPAKPFEMVDR
jgi:hypothetical protein